MYSQYREHFESKELIIHLEIPNWMGYNMSIALLVWYTKVETGVTIWKNGCL